MNVSRSARVLLLVATFLGFAIIAAGGGDAGATPALPETGSALAQDSAPTPTASPADGDQDPASDPPGRVLGRDELPGFLIALLVFGILAFGILFLYLYMAQHRFYGVFSGLAESGKAPQVISVSPFAGAKGPGTLSGATQEIPPTITGPGVVTVGTQSDQFGVEQGGKPLAEAQWSVSPSTAAAVNPVSGANVRVIATTPGAFELKATVPGSEVTAVVQVAAVAAEQDGGSLPFIGSGFGSIAVTILLVVGVTALAFNGSLGSEAVATFFGGLLGYVFGAAAPGGRASRDK